MKQNSQDPAHNRVTFQDKSDSTNLIFKPMDTDSALRLLGKYSRWQLLKYFYLALAFGIIFALVHMPLIFISDTPEHRCFVPSIDDNNDLNNSSAQLNQSVPFEERDGELMASRCEQFVNFTYLSNKTERCTHGYWYDPASGYESTIVTDFTLVCGKSYWVEVSMTIYAIGSVLGNAIYPAASDKFGRRPVFLVCIWGVVLINTIKAFSPNFYIYTCLLFFAGIQEQGMMTVAIILIMELFPTECRTFAGTVIEFSWVAGVVMTAPIAYFLRNWRYLVFFTGAPWFSTILFYWLIPESIAWLVANNREEEAEKILQEAAKFNNITLPQNIFIDHASKQDSTFSNDHTIDQNEYEIIHKKSILTSKDEKIDHDHHLDDNLTTSSSADREKETKENHFKRAINSIRLINRDKVKTVDEDIHLSGSTDIETDINYEASVKDLIKSSTLRQYVLVLTYIWFANDFVYITLMLSVTSLAGNRYLNFFLYGLVEIPAYAVCWIAIDKFGRRGPLIAFNLICGISLVLAVLQAADFASSITAFIVTLNMIAKFAISASWADLYVLTPEVYPTNIRTIGTGVCQFASRMAFIVGPYTRILNRHYPWMPPLISGVVSIIASLSALLLPETRWRPLPESVEQVESWEKKK